MSFPYYAQAYGFVTVDLLDVYFGVRIRPDFQRYLHFQSGNLFLQYTVLPFGLTIDATECSSLLTQGRV